LSTPTFLLWPGKGHNNTLYRVHHSEIAINGQHIHPPYRHPISVYDMAP
jgi:hypothetical protein